jgi:apolipoprotein N-acyltransferase
VRPALSGSGVQRGLKFGFIAFLFHGIYILNWQGVFNLPEKIWLFWWVESLVYLLAGSAALGWVAQKIAPVSN